MASIVILSICSTTAGMQPMNGYDYVLKRMRLFKEISGIQGKWISLNDEYVGIDSISKKVDWKAMNSKAELLLGEFQIFYTHFSEDFENINKELKQEDFIKLEAFIGPAAICIDVFDKTVIKLCKMINKLYGFTLDLESWTFKEHKKEMDAYTDLSDEYEREGQKMNYELEKTRQIKRDTKIIGL
ncbi:MAG: hypothetical protein E4H44_05450 [Candidatus Aminicenantes bacterium]|nr:MAG: hypothetical protein E4H44_05450 [Candidatus Aminicenantes bacterium]